MSEELKPCPFCGGAAFEGEGDHGSYFFECSADCEMNVRAQKKTREEAMTLWNTRSTDRASFDAGWEYHKLLDNSQARLSEAVKVLERLAEGEMSDTGHTALREAAKAFIATLGESKK